jgi:hypothetical protein
MLSDDSIEALNEQKQNRLRPNHLIPPAFRDLKHYTSTTQDACPNDAKCARGVSWLVYPPRTTY